MLRIADITKDPEFVVEKMATEYMFPLDPFQKHAIAAIHQDHNVLVCAKTGSGKTLVGEYQIAYSLSQGKRVFYTTPIKSLSNQKFHDLKEMFPGEGQVGIMTGDIKFCPHAQIIVMTTEILRNLLYKKGSSTEHLGLTASLSLQDVGAVIFDECHYINDKDRGKVWEETMILLPKEVQLILLSATLDKPELFADWLGQLKETPCCLIQTQYRVVPLLHHVLEGETLKPILDEKEVFYDQTYSEWVRGKSQAIKDHETFQKKVVQAHRSGHEGPVSGKTRPVSFHHQLNECVRLLDKKGLLPALCFNLSRKGCEQLAAKTESDLLDSSDVSAALNIFDFHLRHHREKLETLPQYHTLRRLLQKGVSFHHSGVLPLLKEVVEILFSKGYIKLLYCTETFAVGLNMPTKTVIFTQLTKYDDATGGMRLLRTDEYIQMAGRAGRRGKDTIGIVIYLPDREPPTTAEMRMLMKGGKPQVQSRMDFHYDFLLKTIQSKNLKWMDIQDQSYWMKQHKSAMDAQTKEISRIETEMKPIALSQEIIDDLTEKDELELRVKVETNAKRKDSQRRLDRWKDSHLGPQWHLHQQNWIKLNKLVKEQVSANLILKQMSEYRGDANSYLRILTGIGFIAEDGNLTKRGILATECNETHPLLSPEFYTNGLHKDLTAQELFSALACLIEEKTTNETPSIDQLNVPKPVKTAMCDLEFIASNFCKQESKERSYSPESFWSLSTTWVEPIWRWFQGDSIAQICQDGGLFEGNFVRIVLRIANMVDEWTAMATYCEDVEFLDSIRDVKTQLVRDAIVPDSLYLHL